MTAPRILLTGPTDALDDWSRAAVDAGWDPVEVPLLTVSTKAPRPEDVDGAIDWLCITSSNALPFVERLLELAPALRGVRVGVVGARSAARVRALGLELGAPPAVDGTTLAAQVAEVAGAGARVLWPRGPLSRELGRELAEAGLVVREVLAYETSAVRPENDLPEVRAVFFASPSGLRAYLALEPVVDPARTVAVAIGRTTLGALLDENDLPFSDTIALPEPTPEALCFVLAHLDAETPPR